jgi:hypothetical protein
VIVGTEELLDFLVGLGEKPADVFTDDLNGFVEVLFDCLPGGFHLDGLVLIIFYPILYL